MVAMLAFAVLAAAQNGAVKHVRTMEPKIRSLIETGISHSATFRRLVETLDRSDVVVYLEPKLTRQALGGYLGHNIITSGGYRYLHVALDVQGATGRLVPLLAHELQHAVEVAEHPEARDTESLGRLFDRLAIQFGCAATTCSETQAAKDVEAAVGAEMKTTH